MNRLNTFARRVSVSALCLTCSACATAPEPRTVVQTVEVPVSVPCAIDVAKPDLADTASAIQAAPSIFDLAKLLLAGRTQRDAYIAELEAAASGCR